MNELETAKELKQLIIQEPLYLEYQRVYNLLAESIKEKENRIIFLQKKMTSNLLKDTYDKYKKEFDELSEELEKDPAFTYYAELKNQLNEMLQKVLKIIKEGLC
ncbi:MAG: YlbF family regulator [Bacillales bacterium]|jgi:cell fate (sporulation/competence/biofilm development) regulator YlbF (YheA/YmcA/DUF963 family)|nr:YlbF family regulator [Bacillales bacterium]